MATKHGFPRKLSVLGRTTLWTNTTAAENTKHVSPTTLTEAGIVTDVKTERAAFDLVQVRGNVKCDEFE
jgi:hypothetical protein